MDSSRAAWSGASGRAGGRRVWTGLDQGPRLRRRAVTSPPPSPGRCRPVARSGRWRPAGAGRPTITETGASAQHVCQRPAISRVYPVHELAGSELPAQPPRQRYASCRVPSETDSPNPHGLLQSIPPTARQPQGPDCVRARQLGVAASVDPANGPPAAGSRLCSSPPARRCRLSRTRQRRATPQGPD
jgi:hypothetical protein